MLLSNVKWVEWTADMVQERYLPLCGAEGFYIIKGCIGIILSTLKLGENSK